MHLGEPILVARRDDQQRVRRGVFDPPERSQHRQLLTAHRAAGDHDDAIVRARGSSAARAHEAVPGRARRASAPASNLRLPVTVTRDGSAPMAITRRADSSLCMQKASTSASTRPSSGRSRRYRAERPGRDAAVHDCGLDAAPLAFAQDIRPDLAFHQHQQPGLRAVEHAPDDPREVDRKVEDGVRVGQLAPCQLLPGSRRRRDEQAEAREPRLQLLDDRTRREHLAHRDRVDPERRLAVEVERDGQPPEAARAGCRCTCAG